MYSYWLLYAQFHLFIHTVNTGAMNWFTVPTASQTAFGDNQYQSKATSKIYTVHSLMIHATHIIIYAIVLGLTVFIF